MVLPRNPHHPHHPRRHHPLFFWGEYIQVQTVLTLLRPRHTENILDEIPRLDWIKDLDTRWFESFGIQWLAPGRRHRRRKAIRTSRCSCKRDTKELVNRRRIHHFGRPYDHAALDGRGWIAGSIVDISPEYAVRSPDQRDRNGEEFHFQVVLSERN